MKKISNSAPRMTSEDREAIKELAKRSGTVYERLCDSLLFGKAGGGH